MLIPFSAYFLSFALRVALVSCAEIDFFFVAVSVAAVAGKTYHIFSMSGISSYGRLILPYLCPLPQKSSSDTRFALIRKSFRNSIFEFISTWLLQHNETIVW